MNTGLYLNMFISCDAIAMILNRFNEVLHKLHLQVMVLYIAYIAEIGMKLLYDKSKVSKNKG